MQFGPFKSKINKRLKKKEVEVIADQNAQFVSPAVQVRWLYCTVVHYCTNFALEK